jgi:hypothetical protein
MIWFFACLMMPTSIVRAQTAVTPEQALGTITPPPVTAAYMDDSGDNALLNFVSVLLAVATVIAGIWVFVNLIFAGYSYLTGSGDPKSHQNARQWIINSVIGIFLIVIAYAITALVGLLLFGDANFFINPTFAPPQ